MTELKHILLEILDMIEALNNVLSDEEYIIHPMSIHELRRRIQEVLP